MDENGKVRVLVFELAGSNQVILDGLKMAAAALGGNAVVVQRPAPGGERLLNVAPAEPEAHVVVRPGSLQETILKLVRESPKNHAELRARLVDAGMDVNGQGLFSAAFALRKKNLIYKRDEDDRWAPAAKGAGR